MKIYVVPESGRQSPGIFLGPDTGRMKKYVHIWEGQLTEGKYQMSLEYTKGELDTMGAVELKGFDVGALCKVLLDIAKEREII